MASGIDQLELRGRTAKALRKILVALSLLAISGMPLFGEGRVNFNNLQFLPITPAGTYATEANLLAAVIGSTPSVPFFGRTGSFPAHEPTIDGAGLFDAGLGAACLLPFRRGK